MSDFGDYKHVKTRKPHHCVYCGRTIPAGTNARNYHGLWQGDWQNWYTCGFCEKFVEPQYGEPGEGISGDEFSEWLRDSDHFRCKKCENSHYRHHNGHNWIDLTHIEMACGDCGNEWITEIPIESEENL